MFSSRRSRTTWLVTMALCITWGFYVINTWKVNGRRNSNVVEVVEDSPESLGSDENGGFLIHNPGCSIRRWPAFSRKVLPYLQTGKPKVDCIKGDKGKGPDVPGPPIESNATHVFLAPTFKEESCCYRTIKRSLGSTPKWVDNIYSTDNDCKFFSGEEGMKVDTETREFLRVTCRVSHGGKRMSFTDFHAFPVKKTKVEERCETKSSKMSSCSHSQNFLRERSKQMCA